MCKTCGSRSCGCKGQKGDKGEPGIQGKSGALGVSTIIGQGNAILVAGTVVVPNTLILTSTLILPARKTGGGVLGKLTYTLQPGVSFTINSDNPLDTSTVTFIII